MSAQRDPGSPSDSTRLRLSEERNCWLATVRPDGRAHLAPVWFVHIDDRLWIGTGATSVRVRNIRSNPSMSVSLEGGDDPVVVEGLAELVDRPFPPTVVEAFQRKYRWDITTEHDADIGAVVLLSVAPTRWLMGGR